jgi:hypothetical protein
MAGKYALNSLAFQQQQVSFILGYSYRSLDGDLPIAPTSDNLQTPAERLPTRTRTEARLGDELLLKQQ